MCVNQVRSIASLQADSVFVKRVLPGIKHMEIARDVFISGPKFEQGVTLFARRNITNMSSLVGGFEANIV